MSPMPRSKISAPNTIIRARMPRFSIPSAFYDDARSANSVPRRAAIPVAPAPHHAGDSTFRDVPPSHLAGGSGPSVGKAAHVECELDWLDDFSVAGLPS